MKKQPAKKNKIDKVEWIDIYKDWNKTTQSKLTFVDLFSGAGGITKGFELAGLKGICGLDWFDAAGKTYRQNFKHSFIEGDIKLSEKKDEFYEAVEKGLKGKTLNIVAGGFPCQGFSLAGNRIVDDPRNSLYKELLEIVMQLQPEFVVCENVVGIRSMLDGKVEEMILKDFADAGYKMNVTVLRAADYAVPQKRDRVIFIGNRINKTNFYPQPFLEPSQYITTGEAIGDLMERNEDITFNHVPTKHRPDMMERMLLLEEGKSLYKGYSDAWRKCPWNEPSCTIKENHGGVNIHPKLPRVLTAREMARLQSFPDDFIFEGPKNKQLVQLGNAVPPLLAKAIALAIIKSYKN
jgi:DNA (cytosine-5)-methyltransferase 1